MPLRHVTAVLCLTGLSVVPQAVHAQKGNAGAPTAYAQEFSFVEGEVCKFPVSVALEGLSKQIQAGDKTILTGPRSYAIVTNLADPSRTVSLNVPGSFQLTETAEGNTAYKIEGRNLLWGGTLPTLTLAIGRFTFTLDGDSAEVEPLAGAGQTIDVCQMIR